VSIVHNVLTIAGSDPSGGAGIQADLKTFAALGTYGMSVLTGLTAQNTREVRAVHPVPAEFVTAQLDAVFDDIRVDAVKIGMLGTAAVVRAVAAVLAQRRPPHLVLDPVMVATSGRRLLALDAVRALRDELLPLAHLVTPNLPEAAALLGVAEARDESQMLSHAGELTRLGPGILLKGGHLSTLDGAEAMESPDLLVLPGAPPQRLSTPRVATRNSHGTGCTLSAAIAALRPQRDGWQSAVTDAKTYLTGALLAAGELDVGGGNGPLHHLYASRPA
jgi:hydroxymethylpyrimidine/phosphomethylpyrimidine kinase